MINTLAPDDESLNANTLIVFDGICVLCNGFVQFVIQRDAENRFHFMTAQSKSGAALYERRGKISGDYETFFFIADGKIYEKLDAFMEVMARLGWPWRAVLIFKPLPLTIKNWLYERIARNRYRLFGKRDACLTPSQAVKARFLD